ncbi:trypsin-like peptidase domain-containing protein [Algiphilus sp. NNCM1]|uniref:trypsin-like serine peptidase n=1 Tax=Algiphilus sp. TaxID=1872431 RepID=UPI001CA6B3AC|nr:trypsin-like peptidase domain-containing protein [Algiphilus sp.]MBY8964870.1 trypsin-like peptidase domain-containing protein [Algiphilus acroporae]MCI5062109.1 serine protease [Algiphilus sp.]MCI5102552.1 serine protease [Algiphilus sp.]
MALTIATGAAASLFLGSVYADTGLPSLVPQQVSGETARAAHSGPGPLFFARLLPAPATLSDGAWDMPQPGQARWRLLVQSPGAKSLSLELARFSGAPDAHLYLRHPLTDVTQGPYTLDDVNADGTMSTAMVFGDQAIIEVLLPASQRADLVLDIEGVMHGHRDIRKIQENFGESQSCNIDVACPQGDAWRQQIRSVVGLTFRVGTEGAFCTGNLTNNTRQDGAPLVLTAHHCLLRANNAGTVVAYWNFEREACGAGAPRDLTESDNGAILLSTQSASDHTLIRLQDRPPATVNAFFTGWDATGDSVSDGASIHHPSGDVKKISLFTTPLRKDQVTIEGQTVDAWVVRWTQGTTEQGSSGAGIWNNEGRMVGVLFGGGASCADRNASDFYGRMEGAWLGEQTRDSQLCIHLAPDGADTLRLDGLEPMDATPTSGGDTAAALTNCGLADSSDNSGGGDGGGSWWAPALLFGAWWRRRSTCRGASTSA